MKLVKRKFKQFILEDRIRIEIHYRNGTGIREIARTLGRNPESICREISGRPRHNRNTIATIATPIATPGVWMNWMNLRKTSKKFSKARGGIAPRNSRLVKATYSRPRY